MRKILAWPFAAGAIVSMAIGVACMYAIDRILGMTQGVLGLIAGAAFGAVIGFSIGYHLEHQPLGYLAKNWTYLCGEPFARDFVVKPSLKGYIGLSMRASTCEYPPRHATVFADPIH